MSIEPTQADRNAAAEYYYSAGGSPTIARQIREGQKDDWFRVQAFARHRLAHTAPAGEVEPVAWMYRWKIDGEYVNWRYSDASNYHKSLDGYEEVPLYAHPAPTADLVELVTILHQYRSDLLRPPAPDSRERRVTMIDAAIAKFGSKNDG